MTNIDQLLKDLRASAYRARSSYPKINYSKTKIRKKLHKRFLRRFVYDTTDDKFNLNKIMNK